MRLVFPVVGLFMAASACCCCGDIFSAFSGGGSDYDFDDVGGDASWGSVPEALKEFPEAAGSKLTVGSYRDYAASKGWSETVYLADEDSATYIAEKDGHTLSVVASKLGGQLNLTVSLDNS